MDGKGISQPVGADIVYLARLRVYQSGQPGSLGTLLYDLPGSMAVYAENKPFTISENGSASFNVILK